MAANEQDTHGPGTAVSMQDLKPPATPSGAQVAMGFSDLQSFELMQRAAKLLASSSLVPKNYQGNLANCVIALNMSQRIGADPLLVMQNLYVVHGRPAWSAQFTIACFNQCGRFSAMRYEWFGTEGQDDWGCYAWAKERSSGEIITGPRITIGLAKAEGWYQKDGSKWKTIPQLMLMYRAGAWLTRTHAPEITMGLLTAEEMHDVYDARRGADGSYEVTLDTLREVDEKAPEAAGETVDTETGEVTDVEADAIPQYNEASAIKALESKQKLSTLKELFKDIAKDFSDTGRSLPDAVQAKYQEMHDALAEKEGEL